MNRNDQSDSDDTEETSKKSEAEIFFTLYHQYLAKGFVPEVRGDALKFSRKDEVTPGTPPSVIENRRKMYQKYGN